MAKSEQEYMKDGRPIATKSMIASTTAVKLLPALTEWTRTRSCQILMLTVMCEQVRPGNLAEVKEIVLTTGNLILQQRGVIRGVSNWGVFSLPKATSVHQMRHKTGHYFAFRFDASVGTQEAVKQVLAKDPRMIRHTSVKLGDGKLETLSRFGGNGKNGAEGW
ncbi:hypothetical protein BJ170DRAFT_683393 [Xylariales sp. AK1849]|nr:hypothetical protein BJ170DRAFT_683393 [Xylariales sp. AK1849]